MQNLTTNQLLIQFLPDPKTRTIPEIVEDFLVLKRAEETKRAYRLDILPFFEKQNISNLGVLFNLSYETIKGFLVDYFKPEYKPKTFNRKHTSLFCFFNYLMECHEFPFNPAKDFKKIWVERKSTTGSLTKTEVLLILHKLKEKSNESERDARNYLIFIFMFVFALRRNEVVNLQWKNINKESNNIMIYQKGGTYKISTIPPEIFDFLFRFKRRWSKGCGYIFTPTVNNKTKDLLKPISPDLIFKIVKEVVGQIFPDKRITPHSFRKTFIEISMDEGIDLHSIKCGTGHSSMSSLDYYDGKIRNGDAINHIFNLI